MNDAARLPNGATENVPDQKDTFEVSRPSSEVNPVSIVLPKYGPDWNEDTSSWDRDPPSPVELELANAGFEPGEIAILMNNATDPKLAAVILVQRLGVDGAKQIQRRVPATAGDLIFENVVAEIADHPKLLEYQRRYFVVKDFGGHVRVCWSDSAGAFRTRTTKSFTEAEVNQQIELTVDTGKGTKIVQAPAAKVWLKSRNRREFDEARFMPGQRPRPGAPTIYNLWHGWPVEMSNGPPRMMLAHIRDYLCGGDPDTFDWVIGWLSHAVQRVYETPTTALVLAGPQGSGKNVFVKLLFELFAPHTLMCTQSQQLVGNFNSHLMDKLFVFANEAFFAGNKKEANVLKSLVTDETMIVEPKGVDAFQVKKHFRLILASNEDRVVDLELDDRRYCVLRADAGIFNNDREYFGELIRAWRECGEREKFLKYLMDQDLSQWDEGSIPETEARQQQRELSLKAPAKAVYELLAGGEVEAVARDPDTGAVAIRPRDGWTKSEGHYLRLAGAEQKQIAGVGRVWWLPELYDARRRFASQLEIREDWQVEPGLWEWTVLGTPEERVSPLTGPF
jgi:hypothetical protein